MEMLRCRIDANVIGTPWVADDVDFFNLICGSSFHGVKRMHNPSYPSDPRHIHTCEFGGEWREFSWNKAINGEGKRPLHKVLRWRTILEPIAATTRRLGVSNALARTTSQRIT